LKQGLENVLAAARDVKTAASDLKWVIVGEGEAKTRLERLVLEFGLADCVRLLPLQPREDMAEMFASADVLLLNQVGNVKATVVPSKLLTYMAAGKPVLAAVHARSQGAEILKHAGGGVLAPPDDAPALAAAALALRARDRRELVELGRRNRRFAEVEFDAVRIIAHQEEVLKEVVARAHRPGSEL
jgi:colanic acid biosynthesis glycosyl transferase WcaI